MVDHYRPAENEPTPFNGGSNNRFRRNSSLSRNQPNGALLLQLSSPLMRRGVVSIVSRLDHISPRPIAAVCQRVRHVSTAIPRQPLPITGPSIQQSKRLIHRHGHSPEKRAVGFTPTVR